MVVLVSKSRTWGEDMACGLKANPRLAVHALARIGKNL
jgi:hypothetical protein